VHRLLYSRNHSAPAPKRIHSKRPESPYRRQSRKDNRAAVFRCCSPPVRRYCTRLSGPSPIHELGDPSCLFSPSVPEKQFGPVPSRRSVRVERDVRIRRSYGPVVAYSGAQASAREWGKGGWCRHPPSLPYLPLYWTATLIDSGSVVHPLGGRTVTLSGTKAA
jgi:hypothetical protein